MAECRSVVLINFLFLSPSCVSVSLRFFYERKCIGFVPALSRRKGKEGIKFNINHASRVCPLSRERLSLRT